MRRKRNTVLRWGLSSWAMRMKTVAGLGASATADEIEAAFVKKYSLASANGGAVADEYAIHGGGYPVRVRGVEGIVAVVVVSGLKQEDDHAVVAETVKDLVTAQGSKLERGRECVRASTSEDVKSHIVCVQGRQVFGLR